MCPVTYIRGSGSHDGMCVNSVCDISGDKGKDLCCVVMSSRY